MDDTAQVDDERALTGLAKGLPMPQLVVQHEPRREPRHRLIAAVTALALVALLMVAFPQRAGAYPPGLPTKAVAQSELNALTVRAESASTPYDRTLFPHWITVSGCTTRETVLQRDGEDVEVGSDCYPTSGSWYSEWDGLTETAPSDIDIDHVVALSEAWDSGASEWTTSRRQDFANDLTGPQLIAVTDNVNVSKSDKDPAEWVPPLTSSHCAYAKMWIRTKYRWSLTLDSAEKSALQPLLNTCSA
ncbi:HNH endonuclease family protein [Promicromonospora sp. CA-289599]|uniref:HNH endonuclease family protein n=1 Tax=Promicromonospora sp. CA-289599 TaxID=3240014 RepID=UPI003D8F9352